MTPERSLKAEGYVLSVRIPPTERAMLEALAEAEGRTRGNMILWLIRQDTARRQKQAQQAA